MVKARFCGEKLPGGEVSDRQVTDHNGNRDIGKAVFAATDMVLLSVSFPSGRQVNF
jgi:hypothetical protein